jgi:hypothetical protein
MFSRSSDVPPPSASTMPLPADVSSVPPRRVTPLLSRMLPLPVDSIVVLFW